MADGGGDAARHLLFVVREEGIGCGRASRLWDAHAVDVVVVLLQRAAVGVAHFGEPVLRVPDEGLLAAGDPFVARGHVVVGVVVEAVRAADAVLGVVGSGVAVTVAVHAAVWILAVGAVQVGVGAGVRGSGIGLGRRGAIRLQRNEAVFFRVHVWLANASERDAS